MKIRSSEKESIFWKEIKSKLNIVDLGSLTIGNPMEEVNLSIRENKYNIKLTGIEAFEFEDNEDMDINKICNIFDWELKLKFIESIKSDLYLIIYKKKIFRLCIVQKNKESNELKISILKRCNEETFVNWWCTVKKTKQVKPTYEAGERIRMTIFDEALEKRRVYWGGNIDGIYIPERNKISAIIEVRKSSQKTIEEYDPKEYYHGTGSRGGDFNTWLPLFYLSKMLEVPLFLFTFSDKSPQKCGISIIKDVKKEGLFYIDDLSPYSNLFESFDEVKEWIQKNSR